LICRNADQLRALAPAAAPEQGVRIHTDRTGVNVFLEVRKPADA
jgi:hypothetical protein